MGIPTQNTQTYLGQSRDFCKQAFRLTKTLTGTEQELANEWEVPEERKANDRAPLEDDPAYGQDVWSDAG